MIKFIIAALVTCGIVDVATTYYGLKHGLEEGNPIANSVFKVLGPKAGLLALKALCTATICGALILKPNWWPIGLVFLGGYGYVLYNNISLDMEAK